MARFGVAVRATKSGCPASGRTSVNSAYTNSTTVECCTLKATVACSICSIAASSWEAVAVEDTLDVDKRDRQHLPVGGDEAGLAGELLVQGLSVRCTRNCMTTALDVGCRRRSSGVRRSRFVASSKRPA
jgi:hypothetical protein